jgi:hypothetical protein
MGNSNAVAAFKESGTNKLWEGSQGFSGKSGVYLTRFKKCSGCFPLDHRRLRLRGHLRVVTDVAQTDIGLVVASLTRELANPI